MVELVEVNTKPLLKKFIEFPKKLNKGNPHFIPHLDMDRWEHFDRAKNPFFEHGEGVFFLALENSEPVGRITAQYDNIHLERYKDSTGFFGHFEAIDSQAVADALLKKAEEWLKGKGLNIARGPFNFNINDEMGILVDGFDSPPFIMMTYNPPYYDKLVKGAGYDKAMDVFAWKYIIGDLSEQVKQIAEFTENVPDLKVRTVDKKKIDDDIKIVLDIFNDAWAENWGYLPMTDNEIKHAVKNLKMILEPQITFIAELKGEPIAMGIAVPNLNEAIRDFGGRLFPFNFFKLIWRLKISNPKTARLMLLGIKKKFRGIPELKGLSVLLYAKSHINAKKLGYETGELGWTLESNEKINKGIRLMGGIPYKTFRIFEKRL
ncbi:MAG: hypothetical protein Kow0090_00960 [Myxococcota bacterium]